MGAVKRNCRDHSQCDQECGVVRQVTPSADLTSAAEKSQSLIEVHPLCRRAAKDGPQKQKMLHEVQLAQLAHHPERMLLLDEGHVV